MTIAKTPNFKVSCVSEIRFPNFVEKFKVLFCRLLSYQPKDSFPSLPCGKMYLLIEAETSKLETFRSENIWEEIKSKGFLCLPLIFSRHISRLKTLKSDFLWGLDSVKSWPVPCNGYLWTRVAGLGRLSAGAKMAMKPFVKRVFTIFATNVSFLRVISNFWI